MAKIPLAKRIRELREARGWSQETLEAKAGFKKGYVSLIESGKRNPKIDKLEILAEIFETTVAGLTPDEAQATAEERSAYSAANDSAARWERFAKHFKAGDPEEFAKTVAGLPLNEQAIIARLARLLAIEPRLG